VDAGSFAELSGRDITTPRAMTRETRAAVPSDADALAGFPVGDVGAYGVDVPGDFVSGNARILYAGPIAFLYARVGMADAAGFNFDPDLVGGGFGNVSFDEFEITARLADLD